MFSRYPATVMEQTNFLRRTRCTSHIYSNAFPSSVFIKIDFYRTPWNTMYVLVRSVEVCARRVQVFFFQFAYIHSRKFHFLSFTFTRLVYGSIVQLIPITFEMGTCEFFVILQIRSFFATGYGAEDGVRGAEDEKMSTDEITRQTNARTWTWLCVYMCETILIIRLCAVIIAYVYCYDCVRQSLVLCPLANTHSLSSVLLDLFFILKNSTQMKVSF